MDNFKRKTYEAITLAMESKKSTATIYLKWHSEHAAAAAADPLMSFMLFAPGTTSAIGLTIPNIYKEFQHYFFENHNVLLHFGGFNLGSKCSIMYPQEPNEHDWSIYKIILDECMEELEKGEIASIRPYDKMSKYPDTSKYISCNSQDIANLISKAKEYLRPNFKIHYDQTIIKID